MITLRPGNRLHHAGDRGGMEAHHHPAALKNDTFLRALARQPTGHTPIWLMRQAGATSAQYNATRARARAFSPWRAIPSSAPRWRCSPSSASRSTPRSCFPTFSRSPMRWGSGFPSAKAALPAAAARRGGDPPACAARSVGGAALRARRGARDAPGPRGAGAAHRLLRQPVHARLLHGRGRGSDDWRSSRRCCMPAPTCFTAFSMSTHAR